VEEFFRTFDETALAFLYQGKTEAGGTSPTVTSRCWRAAVS